jgi:hypothetical protein
MMNPTSWAQCEAAGTAAYTYSAGLSLYDLNDASAMATNFRACVIDPLGVGDGDPSGTTSLGPRFPWSGSAAATPVPAPPLMPRLTLGPGLAANARVALADSIFRNQDDLAFNVPTDEDLLPTQLLQGGARRLSLGDYSWLMTVVPDPDLSDPANPLAQPLRVSVAVFYKRPLGVVGGGERICDLSYPGGSDGEAELQLAAAGVGPQFGADGAAHLDVQPGQWIMFAGAKTVAGSPRWDFRWHRIVSADQTLDSGSNEVTPGSPGTGPWTKNLTVAGPDWSAAYAGGRAFLFDGVIAVYEQELKLETDSMY